MDAETTVLTGRLESVLGPNDDEDGHSIETILLPPGDRLPPALVGNACLLDRSARPTSYVEDPLREPQHLKGIEPLLFTPMAGDARFNEPAAVTR
jgi:hypothetical protein